MKSINQNNIFFYTIIFLLIFSWTFTKTTDADLAIHLSSGKYILTNKTIPKKDMFSFTAFGRAWPYHEWFTALMLYLIYNAAGFTGLNIFKFFVIFFIIIFLTRKIKSNKPLVILFIIYIFILIDHRLALKPDTLFWLYIILVISLCQKKILIKRDYIFTGILFLIWANTHNSFMLGWFILLLRIIFEIIFDREKIVIKNYFLLLFFSATATIINPFHIKLLFMPFTLLNRINVRETIIEWYPLYSKFILYAHSFKLYSTVIYIFIILILPFIQRIKFTKLYLLNYTIFILFSCMALYSNRFIPIMALESLFILCVCIEKIKKNFLNIILTYAGIIASIFFIVGNITHFNFHNGISSNYFGKNWSNNVPDIAIEYLKKNCSGKIMTPLWFGGYILWFGYPELKTSCDGRLDVFGSKILNEHFDFYSGINCEKLLVKYNPDFIIIKFPTFIKSMKSTEINLINFLYKLQNWHLIFWDDSCLIFSNKTDLFEYKYAEPINFLNKDNQYLSKNYKEIKKELDYCRTISSKNIFANLLTAYLEFKNGNFKISMKILKKTELKDRYNPNIFLLKSYIYFYNKQYDYAEYNLNKVLKLTKYNRSAYKFLNEIYIMKGDENSIENLKKKYKKIFNENL